MKNCFSFGITLGLAVGLIFCATAARAEDHIVNQSKSLFDIESLTIKPGDKVVFKNNDDYTHNIQIVNGAGDINDRGLQKQGQNIEYTFSEPGYFLVRCSMHKKMSINVTVK